MSDLGPNEAGPLRRTSRALAAVVRLAFTRQIAHPSRGALVAVGVAAATAMLLAVYGGAVVSADLRATRSIEAVPREEQLVRVTWSGSQLEGGVASLDRFVDQAVAGITTPPLARSVLLRETNLGGGRGAVLAAADEVDRYVTLESGRMPGRCVPSRCEVVQVLGEPLDIRGAADANVVRVGTGRLTSVLPFGDLEARRATGGAFAQTPVLVTGDRQGLDDLTGLSFVFRTYRWAGDVPQGLTHPWTIDGLFAAESRAAQALATGPPGFALTTPDRALTEARSASRSAAARMLVVGGAAAALLLGFALLAAAALNADHAAERSRLERRGAGRPLRFAFTLAERLWISFTGVAIGVAIALAAVALVARSTSTSTDVWTILRQSILSGTGIALIAAGWIGTSALLVLAQSAGSARERSAGRIADIVAVGCIAVVALAASRGGASAAELALGEGDPLLPALPVLLSLAGGILAARLFGPLVRGGERWTRGAPLRVRLALLSLARRPARAAMTVAFLVVGIGLAVFAESYRATLERGQRDQATFAVPADAVVSGATPAQLATALHALPPAQALTITRVVRLNTGVLGSGSIPVEGTILAVPGAAIGDLTGWRSDFAPDGPTEVARRLGAAGAITLAGADLPADIGHVTLPVARRGDVVALKLLVRGPSGVTLGVPLTDRGDRFEGHIPAAARGGRLVALAAELTPEQQISFGHATGEGRGGDILVGTLRLGPLAPTGGGSKITDWTGWIGRGGLKTEGSSTPVDVRYALDTDSRAILRPAQPTDATELAIVVSRDIWQRSPAGSRLTLSLANGRRVIGVVAGVVDRFPSLPDEGFVLADADQLSSRLEADDPGAGLATEAWLTLGGRGRANLDAVLANPELAPFSVARRDVALDRLRSDPLGRGVLITLTAAAVAALLLGVAALLLAVLSDLRDERRELDDLATQGVRPATIRGQLQARGMITMGAGIAGGVILGVALSLLVVELVLVSAGSEAPVPPLVRAGAWPRIVVALGVYTAFGALALWIATRTALRRSAER